MVFENIILEKSDFLAVLTINRPKALNALDGDTLMEIAAAIKDVKSDPVIKVMIVTGAGEKSFVAGADITFMLALSPHEGRCFADYGQKVFRQLELMEKPVIAAINGFALGGGCELAMACDIRLAAESALFGQPEVGLGIIPGGGGTQRLPRLIGEAWAKELIVTADTVNAMEACRLGLVTHVYPQDQLMDEARKMAGKIAAKSSLAVGYAKAAIGRGMQVDIDTAMSIEADMFGISCASEDKLEGMIAFVEKRKPFFKGR